MKHLNGYDKAQAYTDNTRLPVGGYILKILDVKYQTNDWGDVILLSFDIAEGDCKDFFAQNYRSQSGEDKKWKGTYRLRVPNEDGSEKDDWTMRRFKTVISAFEDSNPGYHWDWDEQTLKGKTIGALFNNKEYDFNGKHGYFTNCHSLVTVDKIRSGKYDIPADTLLKGHSGTSSSVTDSDAFINIPDGTDDLPFD